MDEPRFKITHGKGPVVRSAACPPEEVWYEVAAGFSGSREEALVDHAARCAFCAPLLRAALEDLATEATPEEEAAIARMPPARLPPMSRQPPVKPRWTPALQWGAIAAVFIAGAGGWFAWNRSQAPQALAAKAYRAMRTTEFRLSGLPHAPVYGETKLSANLATQPAGFLEAVLAIRRHADSPEPAWLQATGRAQLLGRDEDQAILTLLRARDSAAPDSDLAHSVEIDIAAAEYAKHRYKDAFERLSELRRKRPADPAVLFNWALVASAVPMYSQAIEGFEAFLKLEPSGPWAEEARRHSSTIRQRIGRILPDISPEAAAFLAKAAAESVEPEHYLDTALQKWLPALEEPPPGKDRAETRRALDRLADLLEVRYHDPWLAEALAHPVSPAWREGAAALSRAAAGLAKSQFADNEARAAAALFERAGNRPMALRARVELASVFSRAFKNRECAEASGVLLQEPDLPKYTWLFAQTLLEYGMCKQRLGDTAAGPEYANRASVLAREHGYRTLEMRAEYAWVGLASGVAPSREVESRAEAALGRLWDGSPTRERAFAFYSDLAVMAESDGYPRLREALLREAIAMIAPTPHKPRESVTRHRLALLLLEQGRTSEAREQFETARNVAASAQPFEEAFRREIELSIAEFEVATGQWRQACKRLAAIEPRAGASLSTKLRYRRALGKAAAAEGDAAGADAAYWTAIADAGAALSTGKNERSRSLWQTRTEPLYRDTVALLSAARNNPQGAFRLWQWFRFAPFESRPVAALDAVPEPAAALESLGNAAALVYVALPDRLGIWFAHQGKVEYRPVAVGFETGGRVASQFARQCAGRSSSLAELRANARQLHAWLIAPFAHRIPAGVPLVIETDGWVSQVPFAALENPAGQALLDERPLTYSPGLWLSHRLRGRVAPFRPAATVVVRDPELGEADARAFPRANESDGFAASLAGVQLSRGNATVDKILQALNAGAEAVYFAVHGLENGDRGGLVVTPSGASQGKDILDAWRLDGVRMEACRLVVLAACSTAAGERRLGPVHPDSLVRVFHRAGVPNVVASFWDVEDGATAQLMKRFFRAENGLRVSESLREAAKEVREKFPHPYYWAAFAVFGRG